MKACGEAGRFIMIDNDVLCGILLKGQMISSKMRMIGERGTLPDGGSNHGGNDAGGRDLVEGDTCRIVLRGARVVGAGVYISNCKIFTKKYLFVFCGGAVKNLEKDEKVEKSRKKSIEISLPHWYNILDNGMESLWKRAIPGRFVRRFDSSPMRVEVLCGSQKISR